ncbi:POK19 protein, partial [Circaetus pectoralis]|nr:POK19 protein [Circaetus pectoralis]
NSFESFPIRSETPVQGLTVFTDASKNSRKASVTWKKDGEWQDHIIQGQEKDSLQTLELIAVVWVFSQWTEVPLNIVSDSLYVVGVVQRLEHAVLKELNNVVLSGLFR